MPLGITMPFSTLRSSSSRRDIIVVITIICLLTIIISFRNIFPSNDPRLPKVHDIPKAESDIKQPPSRPTKPEEVIEEEKEAAHVTSTTSTVTSETTSTATEAATSSSAASASGAVPDSCAGFPNVTDILLVMKTGATEAYDKLPIHFLTTFRCPVDTIYFSDMEMDMGGHHLIDTLEDVSDDLKKNNPDFELYNLLKEYHDLKADPRDLKNGGNGWNLDKYKFIHMLLKTYKYRPDAPWYVFIEADTYLVWDNLRLFLDKLDPENPYYVGSPTYLDIEFAHGGTGYIISGAAMRAAVGKHRDLAEKYDKTVQNYCCGDRMIGRVLLDEDVHLSRAWPMLNGEKPFTLPFGDNHWCQPVITMHHMTAEEVSQVWNFEQERKAQGITVSPFRTLFSLFYKFHLTKYFSSPSPQRELLFVDIYEHFVEDNIGSMIREDWSNLSGDREYKAPPEDEPDRQVAGKKWSELSETERDSILNAEKCRALCDVTDDCYQWQHTSGDMQCSLGLSVKFGGRKTPEMNGNMQWTSGWNLTRIEEFKAKWNNCSDGTLWIEPHFAKRDEIPFELWRDMAR